MRSAESLLKALLKHPKRPATRKQLAEAVKLMLVHQRVNRTRIDDIIEREQRELIGE